MLILEKGEVVDVAIDADPNVSRGVVLGDLFSGEDRELFILRAVEDAKRFVLEVLESHRHLVERRIEY